jgi:hypothetical protein
MNVDVRVSVASGSTYPLVLKEGFERRELLKCETRKMKAG